MRAGRSGSEVDRGPTVGASHGLNVLPQFIDLPGRELTDEVLFSQEFEKLDESAVLVAASPVTEPRVSLQIVR